MGTGDLQILYEEQHSVGRRIALDFGLIQKCGTCGHLLSNGISVGDPAYKEQMPGACAYATKLLKRNDPLVRIFEGDQKALRDAIKFAVEDVCAIECECDRRLAKE